MSKKNVFGLSDNVTSFLCYLFVYVSGIFFFIMEKENKVVRFHALQSTILFGGLTILSLVVSFAFGWIFIIGRLIGYVISLTMFVLWIYLMYTSYKGQMFKVPILGDVIWEEVNK